MNTWFHDIVKGANERAFNDNELERVMVYYGGLPARLRAVEQIEQVERELSRTLLADLEKRYPDRTIYGRCLVRDLLESLRHLAQAMLADEPRLFRRRWLDHMSRSLTEIEANPVEIRDVYELIHQHLTAKLGVQGRELIQPYFDELAEALTPVSAVR